MTIRHHLDRATLLRYAAGDLDESFNIVVASHLAMCEDCRAELRLANEVGGALLDDVEPEPMAAHALDAVLAQLDSAEPVHIAPRKAPVSKGAVPLPLQRLIGTDVDAIKWRSVAPGVGKHVIKAGPNAKGSIFLLKIAPGMAMPEHGHGGDEMTLILQGSYSDSMGRFAAGDIADLDEHVEHTPRVDSDVPCICLSVTETPTRFKGLAARLFQPWFGI